MNDENEKMNRQGEEEKIETVNEDMLEQPEAAQEEKAEAQEASHKRSSSGKHVLRLEAALEAVEKDRDDFRDKYLRTFSDFSNYKKRNLTAVAVANRDGQGEVVEKILPVLDNFERALEPMSDLQDDAFVKGMFMVYRQLSDAVAALGVKEIPAQGEAFDPNLHQAISLEDAENGQENAGIVVSVLQKGYMLDDKVLRHSMVNSQVNNIFDIRRMTFTWVK